MQLMETVNVTMCDEGKVGKLKKSQTNKKTQLLKHVLTFLYVSLKESLLLEISFYNDS